MDRVKCKKEYWTLMVAVLVFCVLLVGVFRSHHGETETVESFEPVPWIITQEDGDDQEDPAQEAPEVRLARAAETLAELESWAEAGRGFCPVGHEADAMFTSGVCGRCIADTGQPALHLTWSDGRQAVHVLPDGWPQDDQCYQTGLSGIWLHRLSAHRPNEICPTLGEVDPHLSRDGAVWSTCERASCPCGEIQ